MSSSQKQTMGVMLRGRLAIFAWLVGEGRAAPRSGHPNGSAPRCWFAAGMGTIMLAITAF